MLAALLVTSILQNPVSDFAASPNSIEIAGFRWNTFPLKVLVNMNQWSNPYYASAVRDAVDIWIMTIWDYMNSFNDTTLGIIRYTFYVSTVNATSSYDILITFTANEFSSNVVGLTSYEWNPIMHEPKPPIIINITTYSGAANHLFVKNVAMHEFGHALGLGHTSSQKTLNGLELMYYYTSSDRAIFPSTLDLYGLSTLYKGSFSQSIQLPTHIPYEMIRPTATNPPNTTTPSIQPNSYYTIESFFNGLSATLQHILESNRTDLIILVVSLFVLFIISTQSKESFMVNASNYSNSYTGDADLPFSSFFPLESNQK
jgi:hypothetical protein